MTDRTNPRDEKGRFVPLACPACDNGTLRFEPDLTGLTKGHWLCDGLRDPNDENMELQACMFSHFDGEEYRNGR